MNEIVKIRILLKVLTKSGNGKRKLAFQIKNQMRKDQITVTEMAKRMNTSRSSVNRLLDPDNKSITLDTIGRAAKALGKKCRIILEN